VGNVGLLYVGAVLFANGCAYLGWIKGKDHAPMNLFVGILQVITPLYLIFTADGDAAQILGASGLFLFGFTYLYVFITQFWNLNGTGLGWFCGFVVLCTIPYAYFNFTAGGTGGILYGILWMAWGFLWFQFWMVLSMGVTSWTRWTGAVCLTQGLLTGFTPALLYLGRPEWVTTGYAVGTGIVMLVLFVIYYFTVKTPTQVATAASESS
jgi:hypothetical protein